MNTFIYVYIDIYIYIYSDLPDETICIYIYIQISFKTGCVCVVFLRASPHSTNCVIIIIALIVLEDKEFLSRFVEQICYIYIHNLEFVYNFICLDKPSHFCDKFSRSGVYIYKTNITSYYIHVYIYIDIYIYVIYIHVFLNSR